MKNRYGKLAGMVLACLAAVLCLTPVRSEENTTFYKLWIGSTQVTSANLDDILGDGGKAKYDPDTACLTLDNPQITGKHAEALIYSEEAGLTIKGRLERDNSSTFPSPHFFIYAKSDITLAGNFSIIKFMEGICVNKNTITVESGSLIIDADCPFTASHLVFSDKITNADLQAWSADVWKGVGTVTLQGSLGYVFDIGCWVVIQPDYCMRNIWLGSTEITADNCNDILGDGKARFDIETHTLILNDPVIPDAYTDIDGFSAKIYSDQPAISIQGSYHMSSDEGCRFGIRTNSLTLNGDFVFQGTEAGLSASDLTLKAVNETSVIELRGGQTALFLDRAWTFDGSVGLTSPQGGLDTADGKYQYLDQGYAVSPFVRIEAGAVYPVWVGSLQVNSVNCGDLFGDGKASYNPDTRTLTLNEPVIPGIHTDRSGNTAKIYTDHLHLHLAGSYHMNRSEAQYGLMASWCQADLSGDFTFFGTVDGMYSGSCPQYSQNTPSESSIEELSAILDNLAGGAVLAGNIRLEGGLNGLRVHGPVTLNGSVTLNGGYRGLYAFCSVSLDGDISIAGNELGICNRSGGLEVKGGNIAVSGRTYRGVWVNNGTVNLYGGSLTASSAEGRNGIYIYKQNLNVYGGSVTASGKISGLYCDDGALYVSGDAGCVTFEGGEYALHADRLTVTNTGTCMEIIEPACPVFIADEHSVYAKKNNVGIIAKRVVIDRSCGIWLGNTVVSRLNCQDVFGDGKAVFDPDSNVLTLNNPAITGVLSDGNGTRTKIYAYGHPLTIRGVYHMTEADSTFGLVTGNDCLTLDGDFTFRGTKYAIAASGDLENKGRLSAEGGTAGIVVSKGNLNILSGSVSASGSRWGAMVSNGQLILQPETESAAFSCNQDDGVAAVVAVNGIERPVNNQIRAQLVYPTHGRIESGSVYDPDLQPAAVVSEGGIYVELSNTGEHRARLVQFESRTDYHLSLGNTAVTPANARDIFGDGKASYDPATRTLTLNNPTISGTALSIENGTASRSCMILASELDHLTVKGCWHMEEADSDVAIQVSGGSLTLDGDFTLRGWSAGVAADSDLTVRSGILYAYGGEIGALCGGDFTVEGGCGHVELKSGSKVPVMAGGSVTLAKGFSITSPALASFVTGRSVDTEYYHRENVTVARMFEGTPITEKAPDKITISDFTGFEGSGSADNPYQITDEGDWNRLAACAENGNYDLSLKHFRLMNDLSVSAMIGTKDSPFSGFFDGGGHTLTFSCTAVSDNCAPFRYVGTSAFENLRVAGTINTAGRYAAGLVSSVAGSCRIVNCVSDIQINSTINGEGSHSGFVAAGSNVTIIGCVFSGSVTGPSATHCAGFLCSDGGGSSVTNCVYNGSMTTRSPTANFIRDTEETVNCYYAGAIRQGFDRGKKMLSVTSDPAVIVNFGGGAVYGLSGITAYPNGLVWNGQFYAGEGDIITMRLSADQVDGARVTGFRSDSGELAEGEDGIWTLVMPDEDVVIRPVLVPDAGLGTEEDPWQIGSSFMFGSLPAGWYEVVSDITFTTPVVINGDTCLILDEGVTMTVPQGIIVGPGSSLAVSGSGTLIAAGTDGGAAIGGGGILTIADGLKVTADNAEDPVPASERAAACAEAAVTVTGCCHPDAVLLMDSQEAFCPHCNLFVAASALGSGTAADPWKISSTGRWNMFAVAVENGLATAGKYFCLTEDITVTAMIGTAGNPFGAVFDGQGHTLTFNCTTSSAGVAPFRYISGAHFSHLRVEGLIITSAADAAGLANNAAGFCTITDCVSAVDIRAAGSGGGHAGFVSTFSGGTVSVKGCAFTGSITGQKARYCAAFLGYAPASCTVADSLYDGTISAGANASNFIRTHNNTTNSYYTNLDGIDRVRGKQARSVTVQSGFPVAVDWGSVTEYSVSGITACPVGLIRSGTFCAGKGDVITPGLTASLPDGYRLAVSAAAAGMLDYTGSAWILTMPDENVALSINCAPVFGSASFTLPAQTAAVETSAFENDGALTAVDAGNCSSIGKWAFRGCSGLTRIRLPKDCSIDPDAFDNKVIYVYAPANGTTEEYCCAHDNLVFVAEPSLP